MITYNTNDLLTLYDDPEFYDCEFSGRTHEISFYQKLCVGRTAVHEVACGTGRITQALAESGIAISGSDISKDMISRAQQKSLAEGLDIHYETTPAEAVTGEYDFIFMATNAFQHFLQFEQALGFLQAAHAATSSEGMLVIDAQVPDLNRLSRTSSQPRAYKTFEFNGWRVDATQTSQYDAITQRYEFSMRYEQNGVTVKKKRVVMRMYFPQELQALFASSGWGITAAYGDYGCSSLAGAADKQIYLLNKIEQ